MIEYYNSLFIEFFQARLPHIPLNLFSSLGLLDPLMACPIYPVHFQLYHLQHPSQRLLRSEEHTSELQSRGHLVCRLLLEKKNYSIKVVITDGLDLFKAELIIE